MSKNPLVFPGQQIHFMQPMIVMTAGGGSEFTARSGSVARGTTITLTAAMIDANLDRNGDSWLDLLGEEPAQVARWGKVMFSPGPWPEGLVTWVHGDAQWADLREAARQRAWAIQDETERAAALLAVTRDFGIRPTSRTVSTVKREPDEYDREFYESGETR